MEIVTTSANTVSTLSLAEARDLTDEIKSDAASFWTKLLRAYEGGAHVALGYTSWGDYYTEEFGESKSRGYQLLEAARIDHALDSNMLERPANDRVARELTPVLKDAGAAAVEEVWGEVVEQHGPAPTAAQVRTVVDEKRNRSRAKTTLCTRCNGRVRTDRPHKCSEAHRQLEGALEALSLAYKDVRAYPRASYVDLRECVVLADGCARLVGQIHDELGVNREPPAIDGEPA